MSKQLAAEIYQKVKDATVTLSMFFEEPINDVFTCSGFFIKGHYIISAAHCVIFEPILPDQYLRASRIFAQVYNVNGEGKNLIYELVLVGVDGAGDIAVLKIDYNKPWNNCLPRLRDQPTLEFGKSKSYPIGGDAFVVGDPLGIDYKSIAAGVVRDNQYADKTGISVQELILLDVSTASGNSGSPILDNQGKVIGLLTIGFSLFADINGGPSQNFIYPVIKRIIKGDLGKCSPHLQIINSPQGQYFRYLKGYMGISWTVVGTIEYLLRPSSDACSLNFNLNTPGTRQVVGIQVYQIDGASGCNFSSGTNSPFLNILLPGDIITHLDDKPLGMLEGQISPTLITWSKVAGNIISIKFRKESENYAKEYCVEILLQQFPIALDIPLGAVARKEIKEKPSSTIEQRRLIKEFCKKYMKK